MCLFYDSRFVHYDDAVVLYVFDDDAVGADSYVFPIRILPMIFAPLPI